MILMHATKNKKVLDPKQDGQLPQDVNKPQMVCGNVVLILLIKLLN